MTWKSTAHHYSRMSIALHWLMVLLFILIYASIEFRGIFPKDSDGRNLMKDAHFLLGLTVFALVWLRLLAREDLRHLLKHKRTYCPQALTPVEKRLLRRRSWVRELWFATGKPVYRFITRKLLRWEDNEGRGPRQ